MAFVTPCVQAIGREEPLLITHRLDTCTEGVLIMGKTKAFVQQFNAAMMRKAALQKTYRALTRAPLSPGMTYPLPLYVPALKHQVHELWRLLMSNELHIVLKPVHGQRRCSGRLCVHQAAAERQRCVHRRAGARGARQPALRAGDYSRGTGQRLRKVAAFPGSALLQRRRRQHSTPEQGLV
jgi:RNA pseudouridylate synthase